MAVQSFGNYQQPQTATPEAGAIHEQLRLLDKAVADLGSVVDAVASRTDSVRKTSPQAVQAAQGIAPREVLGQVADAIRMARERVETNAAQLRFIVETLEC